MMVHDSLFAHPYRLSAFVPCLFLVCEYLVHLSPVQHSAHFRYLYSIIFGGTWNHPWGSGLDSRPGGQTGVSVAFVCKRGCIYWSVAYTCFWHLPFLALFVLPEISLWFACITIYYPLHLFVVTLRSGTTMYLEYQRLLSSLLVYLLFKFCSHTRWGAEVGDNLEASLYDEW